MVVLEMESLVIEGITIFDLNVLLMNVDNIIELGVHEESLSRLFTFAVRCLNNFCSNSSSTFNKDILRLMDKTKESKCWLAQFDPYKAFR